jgi:hypothetical protein
MGSTLTFMLSCSRTALPVRSAPACAVEAPSPRGRRRKVRAARARAPRRAVLARLLTFVRGAHAALPAVPRAADRLPQMTSTFEVRVKGAFTHSFLLVDVPVGARVEHVAARVQADESGKAVGFTAATCNIFLLEAAGAKHALDDPEAVFPAAPGNAAPPAAGSTVNVWIDTPAAAGEL